MADTQPVHKRSREYRTPSSACGEMFEITDRPALTDDDDKVTCAECRRALGLNQ